MVQTLKTEIGADYYLSPYVAQLHFRDSFLWSSLKDLSADSTVALLSHTEFVHVKKGYNTNNTERILSVQFLNLFQLNCHSTWGKR